MADVNVSASGTSNLIVAFSNFRKNAEELCQRILDLSNKLIGEDGGRLKGGDGEVATQAVKQLQTAVSGIMADAAVINKELDDKLGIILSMNKGAANDLVDKAKKDVSQIGTVTKKH